MSTFDSAAISKPKVRFRRRWFRFSLRTFLVLIVAAALPFAWYVDRAERQRRAVKWIEKNGGYVQYDWQDPNVDPMSSFIERLFEPPQKWIPIDYLHAVTGVQLLNLRGIDEMNLANALPSLQVLEVKDCELELAPLAEYRKLKRLTICLRRNQAVDLSPLAKLLGLERLEIDTLKPSAITKEQLDSLRTALPNCTIKVVEFGIML